MNEQPPELLSEKPDSVLEFDDRISARLDVYHEKEDEEPTYINSVFSELIPPCDERVYSRKIKVSEEWQPIDIGWLNSSGFLLIQNTKKKYKTNPDENEIEIEKKKTIVVRTGNGEGWKIKGGSFFFGNPVDMNNVEIKCEFESTAIEIHVFPRSR
tara:strand:- start:432 stop:899 length:468 start_codon:yes stop_codon:yes gene_type:complete